MHVLVKKTQEYGGFTIIMKYRVALVSHRRISTVVSSSFVVLLRHMWDTKT
jgi:hypothetical protein